MLWGNKHPRGVPEARDNFVWCICQAKRNLGALRAGHEVSQTPTHTPLFCRSHHSAKPVSSVRLRGISTVQSHRLCVPRICFVSACGLSG